MLLAMASPIAPWVPRPVRGLLGPLGVSAGGMARQQAFMEVIAENIANAETLRTADGGPYRRQVMVARQDPVSGRVVMERQADQADGRLVYDPGHPEADASGYVRYPNVDLATETVDLLLARRMHEANATAFQAAKAMLRRALEL